jgi:hypothetical protein
MRLDLSTDIFSFYETQVIHEPQDDSQAHGYIAPIRRNIQIIVMPRNDECKEK